jgi:hypothetical protein
MFCPISSIDIVPNQFSYVLFSPSNSFVKVVEEFWVRLLQLRTEKIESKEKENFHEKTFFHSQTQLKVGQNTNSLNLRWSTRGISGANIRKPFPFITDDEAQ